MEYSYYPGCSLHSTGWEYNASVQAVFKTLDITLDELDDWNCCGASSAHCVSRALALALPARNLAIAQISGRDVIMPCAACYNRHKTADYVMRNYPDQRAYLEETVGFQYSGQVRVRPLLDILVTDVGLERIRAGVRMPLEELKVVAYYGCLLVRPPEIACFDDPENPTMMNRLLEALGAQVHPWSYATDCCGGGLSLTKPQVAAQLVRRLVQRAREAGAEAVVTSCPLCQINLEMRQGKSGGQMPVFYFTELVGLAFGLEEAKSWWGKHLVDPRPILAGAAKTTEESGAKLP